SIVLLSSLWLSHHVDGTDAGTGNSEDCFPPVLLALHASRGGTQQLFTRLAILRKTRRSQTHAQPDHRAFTNREQLLFDSVPDAVGNRRRHLTRAHRHDGHELVAGITRQNIHLT